MTDKDKFWKWLEPDRCAECPCIKECAEQDRSGKECWEVIAEYYHETYGGEK